MQHAFLVLEKATSLSILGLILYLASYFILDFVIISEHKDWDMIGAQKSNGPIFVHICTNIGPLFSEIRHSSYAFHSGMVGYMQHIRVIIWMLGAIVISGLFFCALIHLQLFSNFKTHLEQFDLRFCIQILL